MKKPYSIILVLLLCLTVCNATIAQGLVRGVVLAKSGRQPIAGVGITVKGSTNGTTSDARGRFRFQVARDTSTLQVESIGYEGKELKVRAGDSIVILLKMKCHLDFFYQRYVETSFYSGITHTPFGGRIKLFNPYVFEARNMQPAIRTEIGYQSGGRNYQQSARLAIDELVASCGLDIGVAFDFQHIKSVNQDFDFKRSTITVAEWGLFGLRKFPLIIGIGEAQFLTENDSNKFYGAEIGTKWRIIPKQSIMASASATWWQSDWQFRGSIEKDATRYSIAADFNKIGRYEEVNLRLGFKWLY